jgi:primosomal protein N''
LSDIVERLRQKDYATRPVNPDGYEAADEIVRLRAEKDEYEREMAALLSEREVFKERAAHEAQIAADYAKWLKAAEAERDRLRDALTDCANDLEAEIVARYDGILHYPSQRVKYDLDMSTVEKARAALKGDTP